MTKSKLMICQVAVERVHVINFLYAVHRKAPGRQIRSIRISMFCARYASTYLFAVSIASLLGGGTVKQTEGTMASLPLGLITFHFARWELLASTHSSSL